MNKIKQYRKAGSYWLDKQNLFSLPENEFFIWAKEKNIILEYERIPERYHATKPKTKAEFEKMFSDSVEYVKRSAIPRFWKFALHRELLRHYILPEEMGNILDFGCGAGNDGLFYANMGFNVTFADVEGHGLEFIRWRLKRRGITARVINSDEQFESYDFVMAIDCLEHIMNADDYFKRLDKSLRVGGLLYFHFQSESGGMDCFSVAQFSKTIGPIVKRKYRKIEDNLYRKIS
jgi:2-polyprenyl-3-methyl-5-hydroxy-6-metoxy-1,4-benzoquinol methylase